MNNFSELGELEDAIVRYIQGKRTTKEKIIDSFVGGPYRSGAVKQVITALERRGYIKLSDKKYPKNNASSSLMASPLQQIRTTFGNSIRELELKNIFLYTFDFQGKDFYPKFGFKEVYVKRQYPLTGTEHFFVKKLSNEIDKEAGEILEETE